MSLDFHSIFRLAIVFAVVVAISALLQPSSFIEGRKRRKNDKMWMDGLADDTNINCPSIRFVDSAQHFSPPGKMKTSSVRCSSCGVLKSAVLERAQRMVDRGQRVSASIILEGDEEIGGGGGGAKSLLLSGKPLCEAVYDTYELKERVDGHRLWRSLSTANTENGRGGDADHQQEARRLDAEKKTLSQTHLVTKEGGEDLLPLKFHTPEERRTLPCARYLLRELCFREISQAEDKIEDCIEQAAPRLLKRKGQQQNKKARSGDGRIVVADDDELSTCVDDALSCERRWCHSKLLANAHEVESLHFAWYEGAFGNPKFSYVADPSHKGRNMLNPYRAKGEKAALNPWLNGTWQRVENQGDL